MPGALAYGCTQEEALAAVRALTLRVLAERLEQGEPTPALEGLFEPGQADGRIHNSPIAATTPNRQKKKINLRLTIGISSYT